MSSDRSPLVVECVGPPGSGKSTLSNDLIERLNDEGARAASIVGWARSRAAGGSMLGGIIETSAPRGLRSRMLWTLFYVQSLLGGLVRVGRSSEWRRVALRQAFRPLRWRVRSHIAYWFIQLVGRYEVVTRNADPSEVVVVDDGFFHRAGHLFASHADRASARDIERYVAAAPLPDLLIRVQTPVEVCLTRIQERGVWAHSKHLTDQELALYLEHVAWVIDQVVSAARRRGLQIIDAEGTGDRQPIAKEAARLVLERMDSAEGVGNGPEACRGIGRVPRFPRKSRVAAAVSARFERAVVDTESLLPILDAFGLEPAGSQRNLRLSRRSQNVVVDTLRGRKVVKIYRPQWTEATVECGHSILRRLEAVGFPAPVLVRAPNGGDQVQTENGVAAVFDFLPGVNLSMNYLLRPDRLRITAEAGATLARLHRALDGFEPAGEHHLGFVSPEGPRQREIDWYADMVADLARRSTRLIDPDAQDVARRLIARSDDLLAGIADLHTRLRERSFRRLVIHGDYGIHNLLFSPDLPTVPVDFELSRLDWRLNDLISALGKHRYRDGSYDFESMRTFLSAYASRYPLTVDEAEGFDEAWRLYKLQAAVQYWYSYFMTDGPVRKLHSAMDAAEQADQVANDSSEIVALVRSARTR